ncbi:hypothetical protein AM593_04592, partial [Mytilus galloprovincialis]
MSLLKTKRASGVNTKFNLGIYDEFIDSHVFSVTNVLCIKKVKQYQVSLLVLDMAERVIVFLVTEIITVLNGIAQKQTVLTLLFQKLVVHFVMVHVSMEEEFSEMTNISHAMMDVMDVPATLPHL